MAQPAQRGFTVAGLLVMIGILIGLLLPAVPMCCSATARRSFRPKAELRFTQTTGRPRQRPNDGMGAVAVNRSFLRNVAGANVAWTCVVCVAVVLITGGCGGGKEIPLGEVSGTVTYQGKPVTDAIVHFLPENGASAATAVVDSEGRYTLSTHETGDGAVVGKHKVWFSKQDPPGGPAPAASDESSLLPEKYRGEKNCAKIPELTKEVKAGSNTIPLELK